MADVKFAFGQASSHQLSDIVDFAALPARGWKYTAVVHGDNADSNACAVGRKPSACAEDSTLTGATLAASCMMGRPEPEEVFCFLPINTGGSSKIVYSRIK